MADHPSDEARRQAHSAAQTLERRGLADAAVQAYLAAGAPEDAARLLFTGRRYLEAAKLLVDTLQLVPAKAATFDASGRRAAMQAAICFARAGETTAAVHWFVALGERERAAELLRRSGDPIAAARVLEGGKARVSSHPTAHPEGHRGTASGGMTLAAAQALEQAGKFDLALEGYLALRQSANAARMCLQLGRHAQAGELFVQAGMPFEAAAAYADADDLANSLESLLRVPREEPRYRAAAVQAIRLGSQLNLLDFKLENFLTRFIALPPASEREVEALYLLGKLYQKNDFLENARDAYQKVLQVNGGYRDARARLQQIEAETKGSAMVYEQILREDQAFRDATHGLPELPNLPDFPGLPGLPSSASSGPPSNPAGDWAEGATVDALGRSVTPQLSTSDVPTVASVPPRRFPTDPPTAPRPPTAPIAATSGDRRPVATPPPGPTLAPPPAPTLAPAPVAAPRKLLLEPGAMFAERYRLVKKIGQGGMAAVFQAHDLELAEDVAIKVFTKLVEDENMVARFKQELLLSRKLNHPNIIRLYDIGTVDGFRYITMELLRGVDLKSRLGQPLTPKEGVGFLVQACAALEHAHERGVVHRDIKPANLFLTDDGVVKLMDFGIAKRTETPGLTVAGMIAGTPEYMSPEQISGFDKVTASTDLYALGVMAYELFTGNVPFRHPEIMPLLVMQMQELPEPPRKRNPQLPAALERVILKLLEKDPKNRYASCRELADALRALRL